VPPAKKTLTGKDGYTAGAAAFGRGKEQQRTTTMPLPVFGRPRFGLDAPAVVRNLLFASAAGFAAWIFELSINFVLWSAGAPSERFTVAFPLYLAGLWVAIICGLTCGIMIWYSYAGKLRMRERLLDAVHWRGDEQVLDVGCGRGLMLVGAAARLKTGKATGIDLWQGEDLSGNSPQATLANARAAGLGDRVEVRTGDARELPFPNASFDVILSTAALHNIYDAAGRERAVRELVRVLKPGGRVVIADIRHTRQYAAILGSCGFTELRHRSGWFSIVAILLTFGSVRPATLTGRKRV
jgi:ubiquinone/menaquinone biosynthesis C-methylase UbiE